MIYTFEQETTVNNQNKNVEETLKSYSYCGFNSVAHYFDPIFLLQLVMVRDIEKLSIYAAIQNS